MSTITQNNIRLRSFPLLITLFVSACCVVIAGWAVWTLDLKWALFTLLGMLFPFALVLIKNIRRFILGMLIFSIPLNADYNFMYHPSPGGANSFSIGLTEVLLFFLFCHTLFNVVSHKGSVKFNFFPAISWPALFLLLFYCLSVLNSTDLLWSAFDIFNLLKVFIFFLVIANNIRQKDDVTLLLTALFLGLVFQAVIVGLQSFSGTTHLSILGLGESNSMLAFEMETADVSRPGGTVGHCNHLARYIGLLLPLSIILSLVSRSRLMRWFSAIVSIAGIVALISTLTRSSWIGLLASIFIMVPYMFAWRLMSFRTISKFIAAMLIFAGIIIAFGPVIIGRITSYDLGSARTRITTAKVAWNIIQDHPALGIGINNYGTALEKYWDADDPFTRKAAVHNTYLLYMAEIGFIGFAVYLWLLIAFFIRIKKAIRGRVRLYSAVAIGIMGSFAGFLLTALTDKSYKESYTLLLIFFTLAAIIEGIIQLNKKSDMNSFEYGIKGAQT